MFAGWTSEDGVTFADRKSAETTFTMPASAVTVTATYEDVVLREIAITTQPTKVEYTAGETFDKSGMVVTATYSDGSSKAITDFTFTPEGALTTEDSTVTISFTERNVTKTVEVPVTVKAPYVPPYIPPAVEVTVPISGDEETIHVEANVSGEKATVDEVDLSHLDTVIGEHVGTGVVTIDFSGLESSTPITTVEIPSDVVKEIAAAANDPANDAESLEVILSDGTSIEFDAEALGEKAAQAGGLDVTISIERHENAKLTDAQKDAVGGRPAYDINVTSGGKRISDMGGKVSVHAPYTLKPGEKARGIAVWYVDEEGDRERCEASYDPARKRVNWTTDHLSLYMIDYEDSADFDDCLKDAACPIAPFEDASANAWYHDGMHWAIDAGVIRGYGSGLLGPGDDTTRAQAFAMIHRLEGEPKAAAESTFADVEAGAWYADPLAWAQEEGIAHGYGDGTNVGPDDPLTREQLAVILYRYAQWKGMDVTASADLASFADASDVSTYAATAMRWAVAEGVIRGYDDGSGELGPKDPAARAQVATMLMRFSLRG